jgi:hypothetical protein
MSALRDDADVSWSGMAGSLVLRRGGAIGPKLPVAPSRCLRQPPQKPQFIWQAAEPGKVGNDRDEAYVCSRSWDGFFLHRIGDASALGRRPDLVRGDAQYSSRGSDRLKGLSDALARQSMRRLFSCPGDNRTGSGVLVFEK